MAVEFAVGIAMNAIGIALLAAVILAGRALRPTHNHEEETHHG